MTMNLCKKALQKHNALAYLAAVMKVDKKRTVMKAFIESQFGYYPLIWMFHSRSLNKTQNRIHEIVLRSTNNDKPSTFLKLLEKDNLSQYTMEILKF